MNPRNVKRRERGGPHRRGLEFALTVNIAASLI